MAINRERKARLDKQVILIDNSVQSTGALNINTPGYHPGSMGSWL
jgi:hypothetical protein